MKADQLCVLSGNTTLAIINFLFGDISKHCNGIIVSDVFVCIFWTVFGVKKFFFFFLNDEQHLLLSYLLVVALKCTY